GMAISELGSTADREVILTQIYELCLWFIYIAISDFFCGFLMAACWSHNGKTLSKRFKHQYFNMVMQRDQSWFDIINPYELATKIQLETDAIENGLGIKIG